MGSENGSVGRVEALMASACCNLLSAVEGLVSTFLSVCAASRGGSGRERLGADNVAMPKLKEAVSVCNLVSLRLSSLVAAF